MKTISITTKQYEALGRKLPKKNVAVSYNEPGISQYSKSVARPTRLVTKGR